MVGREVAGGGARGRTWEAAEHLMLGSCDDRVHSQAKLCLDWGSCFRMELGGLDIPESLLSGERWLGTVGESRICYATTAQPFLSSEVPHKERLLGVCLGWQTGHL